MSRHRASRPAVRRLLTAYACAAIATGMPWPLLLVLVWDQYGAGPHGALVVGLVGAARMAPYVLLSWAVGSLGDHVARDRLVRTTMALRLLFLALAGVALTGDRIALGVVAASLAVAAGTPTYPAIAASLPGLAGARRAQATDLLVTIEVSSWVVGPALGGLLLAESHAALDGARSRRRWPRPGWRCARGSRSRARSRRRPTRWPGCCARCCAAGRHSARWAWPDC